MDIVQHETFSSSPSSAYQSHYPLPPIDQQPPNMPLLAPHAFQELFDLGLLGAPPQTRASMTREYSLLPENKGPQVFKIANDGAAFDSDDWSAFNVSLALEGIKEGICETDSKSDTPRWKYIRPTCVSPLLKVNHQLTVQLACSYEHDAGGGAPALATETLHFALPLHFVIPAPSLTASTSPSMSFALVDPYAKQTLRIPAYSQLFYPNGDPREDLWQAEGDQLPVYRKEPTEEESAPFLDSQQ